MLAETITLNDGVGDRTFVKVSQNGMDSVRAETTAGITSAANSQLVIKHTLDPKKPTKANRHLVSLSYTEQDANGTNHTVTAHAVITRSKGNTDAVVLKVAEMLANFVGTPANVSSMLSGGN